MCNRCEWVELFHQEPEPDPAAAAERRRVSQVLWDDLMRTVFEAEPAAPSQSDQQAG